jgi:predicted RNase H-like HicB family nuclease
MRKLTYYAVFEPASGGSFGVYWPDLPGCTSFGTTFYEAESMAFEALGLHIYSMEQDGDVLPEATIPPFKETLINSRFSCKNLKFIKIQKSG